RRQLAPLRRVFGGGSGGGGRFCVRLFGSSHDCRAPFVLAAAPLGPPRVRRHVPRRDQQPRRQDRLGPQRLGLAGQDQERRLRHVVRQVPITHLTQSGGVDQVHVPLDQPGERLLRTVLDV